jgi:hypothetical protein
MGEFTSKVTVARPNSTSLRATVPEGIVQLLNLKAGDEIVWTVRALNEKIQVCVSKKKG